MTKREKKLIDLLEMAIGALNEHEDETTVNYVEKQLDKIKREIKS